MTYTAYDARESQQWYWIFLYNSLPIIKSFWSHFKVISDLSNQNKPNEIMYVCEMEIRLSNKLQIFILITKIVSDHTHASDWYEMKPIFLNKLCGEFLHQQIEIKNRTSRIYWIVFIANWILSIGSSQLNQHFHPFGILNTFFPLFDYLLRDDQTEVN